VGLVQPASLTLAATLRRGETDNGRQHPKEMIRLNKKLLFAIEAVLDIAYNGGAAPVRSVEITSRQGIPRRYLEPVLQELVRHNVLIGIRGPSGGYRLARERRRITVGEIVRTVRGLETVEDPIEAGAGSALGIEVLRPLWLELQQDTMTKLDQITLEDLCTRAHRAGIAGRMVEGGDFSI
jgi:Rrf2 family transcriptional regulator, iron-sulfur cluster assembly transcription factor